jgi:sulfoxide reductase catalytic subunit YedY
MFIHKRNPLDPVGGQETPEFVYLNRRKFLVTAGLLAGAGTIGYAGWRNWRGTDEQVLESGQRTEIAEEVVKAVYPARRDDRFTYDRPETEEAVVARYTNFFEFSTGKDSWKLVGRFKPDPWTLTVDGLCRKPLKLDVDDLLKRFAAGVCERQYRHRCVETWAMCVPWTGIPLADLVKAADPKPEATHVRFVSFNRPDEAPGMNDDFHPWPYQEGLSLAEAGCELAFLATGMYGHPLLKQNGAPIRLIVPWKYGYKSIKSIERIEFVSSQPATFWNTMIPHEYGFESNVNPAVAHPRWSQATEWMLGTRELYPTLLYNGYEEYVAELYKA